MKPGPIAISDGGDRVDPGEDQLVQYRHREGVLDLGWGHPDPDLLPVEAWSRAWGRAAHRWGHRLLTYGHGPGPLPFRRWLGDRLGLTDGRRVDPEDVVVTAGASHALDLLATAHTRPGDLVLVQSPTYHLAVRILGDHGLIPLAMVPDDDGRGIDVVATRERVRAACVGGRRVSMIYVVGAHANPTGRSLAHDEGADLALLAGELGAVMVEDDTYRELTLVGRAPDSAFSADSTGRVARIGSLSKVVAPALRIGWITAPGGILSPIAEGGLLDSGGGVAHAQALAAVEFAAEGAFDVHLAGLRTSYRERRDALVDGLRRHCPHLHFDVPEGGWFLWVDTSRAGGTPDGLARAHRHGVGFLPGTVFVPDPVDPGGGDAENRVRLAFSMFSARELAEAAARLGRVFPPDGGA